MRKIDLEFYPMEETRTGTKGFVLKTEGTKVTLMRGFRNHESGKLFPQYGKPMLGRKTADVIVPLGITASKGKILSTLRSVIEVLEA